MVERGKVVWIVGGGLAGLATAAALRKLPHLTVYILECQSAEDYYSEQAGAVAKVGPNGLKAIASLDPTLPERIIQAGQILHAIKTPNLSVKDTSLETAGWPQILIPWGILRKFLQELVPREIILTGLGDDICGYLVDERNKIRLVNEDSEAIPLKGATIERPDWIVAADGVNSPFQSLVRMQATILKGPDAPAIRRSNLHDNGRCNINAIVHQPLRNHDVEQHGGTALGYTCDRYTCFCVSLGAALTSLAVSVNDRLDECGSLVQYFAQPVVPSASQAQKECLLELLSDAPTYIVHLLESTDPQHLFIRRSTQLTLVGPTFVSLDGRVVLVGDAAHHMSPSYGQTFNFGLEDAVTLAWAVSRNNLELYSQTRVKRCEEMFRRSAERVVKKDLSDDTVLRWIESWEPPEIINITS